MKECDWFEARHPGSEALWQSADFAGVLAWLQACRRWEGRPELPATAADIEISRAFSAALSEGRPCSPESAIRTSLAREVLRNPFREPDLRAEWLTTDVTSMAAAVDAGAGEQGRLKPEDLRILADALEEAGCPESSYLLRHLRDRVTAVLRVHLIVKPSPDGWVVFQSYPQRPGQLYISRRFEDAVAWAKKTYGLEEDEHHARSKTRRGRSVSYWSGWADRKFDQSVGFPHVKGCWAVAEILRMASSGG